MTRMTTFFAHKQFVWSFLPRLFKKLTNYNKNFKDSSGDGYFKM